MRYPLLFLKPSAERGDVLGRVAGGPVGTAIGHGAIVEGGRGRVR